MALIKIFGNLDRDPYGRCRTILTLNINGEHFMDIVRQDQDSEHSITAAIEEAAKEIILKMKFDKISHSL